MKYKLIALAWLLTMGVMPLSAQKTNDYRTDLLQRIATMMNLKQRLDTLSNGEHWRWVDFKGVPVTVIVENNRVEHIGHSLFTPYQRAGIASPVVNFLERYSLELAIPTNRQESEAQRLKEDGLKFHLGSTAFLPTLVNDTTLALFIQTLNERGYTLTWVKDTTRQCILSFPIDYELLNGTEMQENERRLKTEIERVDHIVCDTTPILREQLKKMWQANYYVKQGEVYYFDNLNSNRYFEMDKHKKLRPIYSRQYPMESLANLFTNNDVDNQFIIDISLRTYGFNTTVISVPLRQWISFCLQTGCKPFFGAINIDEKGTAECELIMRNVPMGYNHIMKVTFPMSQFESRTGHIKARLNSYITSSRIKNLFDEINK